MRRLFLFATVLALLVMLTGRAGAESTSLDLYRWGNASSPKLDNVRPTDLATYKHDGQDWVEAKSGGISVFSTDTGEKNTWKLPKGTAYAAKLFIFNDHDNHWSIQPSVNMTLVEYQALLRELGARFVKVPR